MEGGGGSSLAVPTQYGTGALGVVAGRAPVSVALCTIDSRHDSWHGDGGGVAHLIALSRQCCCCIVIDRATIIWYVKVALRTSLLHDVA